MIRTILLALLVLSPTAWAASPPVQEWVEGVHYERALLDNPSSLVGRSVIEFYWLGCGHCRALHPFFEQWRATADKDVAVRAIPAPLSDVWWDHAQFAYAIESTGKLSELHSELYDIFNGLVKGFKSEEWLASKGISTEDMRTAMGQESFAQLVADDMSLVERHAQDLAKRGVPTVIVNGKWVINNKEVAKGDYPKVIDHLLDL